MTLKVSVAQNDIEIRIASFGDGNTASVEDILQYPSITLINKDPKTDVKLLSYTCVFNNLDSKRNPNKITVSKNQGFRFNEETIRLLSKYLPGEDFIIKDIQVEVTNEKTRNKEIKELTITLKVGEKSILPSSTTTTEYNGKLVTGKNRSEPVVNQKIMLQDQKEQEVQTTVTDNAGAFSFKDLNANESYKLNVSLDDDSKIKDGQLYAAKPDGTVIRSFNKTKKGFVYELLPNDVNILTRMKEEDTELTLRKFGTSKESQLTVIEYIYYDPNSAEIKNESIGKLDKIIIAMEANKSLKLVVASHTDAKGEDGYNVVLSQKRAHKVMQYFILQGIEKERLVATGLGESQIMNRCKNGIDCNENEHQKNRRTEFKFTK